MAWYYMFRHVVYLQYKQSLLTMARLPETDNGPNFTSRDVKDFQKKWLFNHQTSSSLYPKSNGLVERAVKTAKNLIGKCLDSEREVELVLNFYKTSRDGLPSPAQCLFSRRTRTLLPTSTHQLEPEIQKGHPQNLRNKREKQKTHHGKTAKTTPSFKEGEKITLKQHQREWIPAKDTQEVAPRSYKVQTPTGEYRSNSSFITAQVPKELDTPPIPFPSQEPRTLYMTNINPEVDIHTDKTPQLADIVIRVHGPICSMDKTPSPALYMTNINTEEDIHTAPQLAGIVFRAHGPICSMDKTTPMGGFTTDYPGPSDIFPSQTISRRLVANGLHSCRPLRRLPLTPPNRRQRLEWCRARSTWMTEWHRVVFSDESRFCLSSDSRRVRVWRRRGERSNPAAIVERPTVRQRGIMVWGAIAYDSRSPLLRIQGTMTAQRYVDDVLRPVTLPYLQGVPNALYQQDNARPHTARINQQALQDVQMLPWPPYSPDLSPIEHVWDIMGHRLHALPQQRSEDELWQMVEREWRAIPQDAIRTLIDSLPRCVAACIAVRGGPTCY
ncbi:K02A2.6-like [Cordylochernes scorpioides]|uniref:K02A2.6-like n=1 Tax=Cordylochernes scorpioides TaxID=51811 RepID=A0ABY6KDM2_9ARAC|nr:K02A2.6-like [Cordylochernes scorpioides]